MKVSIEEIEKSREEEILIRCHEVTSEIKTMVSRIRMESQVLLGYHNERMTKQDSKKLKR